MAIRYYDDALCEKIKHWISDAKELTLLGPTESNIFFRIEADKSNDNLKLPLIAISRLPEVTLDYPHKKPMSFDGKDLEHSTTYSYILNAIPMRLQYQIDIYTRYDDEGDEILRELIFNLVNHPRLKIELPYNDVWLNHIANIDVGSTINENSDIPNHLFKDQFTRWTITLNIRDAYLFSIPKRDNVTAEFLGMIVDDGEDID